uniref:Uncharacterized protein MANES_07G126600 n=1 Tax=Rhizophora mucronata TaxID=61149 RepID=A0A2P2M6P4_RHIMU
MCFASRNTERQRKLGRRTQTGPHHHHFTPQLPQGAAAIIIAVDRSLFERDGSDHNLVVESCKCCPDEWTHPKNPMIIPGLVPVVDDCGTKAAGWVDASPCNWDGGQVNQEHSEPNRQRCQDRNMRVSGASLGIGGREDGVNEYKGAHNLSAKPIAFGIAAIHLIGTATQQLILSLPL